MTKNNVLQLNQFSDNSTEELKQKLLQLTHNQDTEPFSKKVRFYENELAPIFEEMTQRNPFPSPEDQVSLVQGVWTPIWSTIPFQDILPGRVRDESYQIFHDNSYYANIARYAPGHQVPFLQKLLSFLLAFDLMVLQKYEIKNGQWFIQNVGIKQALRIRTNPLDIEAAENWLTKVVKSEQISSQATNFPKIPLLKSLNQKLSKQLKGTYQATPQFEHLYIDNNFRIVKTKREEKQRPSYTIAVRK